MAVAASMDYAMVGRQLPWPPLWISPWMMGARYGWWGAARGGKGVAVVGKDTAAAS